VINEESWPNARELSRWGHDLNSWQVGVFDGFVVGTFDAVAVVAGSFDDAWTCPLTTFPVGATVDLLDCFDEGCR
jgi:hypothetical protein